MSEPSSTRSPEQGSGHDGSGRRCHVTLLFTDVCDYTTLAEALDPEDAYRLRRYVEQLVAGVIRKHGGTVSQFYGDGTLAVFGYPVSQEGDERRAVEAALEVRELTHGPALEGLIPRDMGLFMHFGIHSGLVFARDGDSLHGRVELTGDAVNTAARLCAAAGQDEVLASEVALGGIEAFYHLERVDLSLKGKRSKVMAARVLRPSGVNTRFEGRARRGLSTLVGREPELSQLLMLMEQARAGAAQVGVLVGGPGIGKTRLLEELRGNLFGADVEVLRGYCESYGALAPLQPLLHMLRQLLGVSVNSTVEDSVRAVHALVARHGEALERHVPTFLHVLSLEPWPSVGAPSAEEARLSIASAFVDLFGALSSKRPLVVVFDDFQWADELSHYTLTRLARSLGAQPMLLLIATRELDPSDPVTARAHVVALRPLEESTAAQLIADLLPGSLDLGLTVAMYRRSGGNPLFLEELCRALPADMPIAEGVLEQARVPYTVQGLIQVRLEQLPPALSDLIGAASVIGNELSAQLLSRIARDPSIEHGLQELVRHDLIHPSDTAGMYRFKHGITREVVYESVRLADRRRIHAAIAQVLQEQLAGGAPPELDALAYHYLGSGDHARAAQYAERAGDRAMATSSLDRARAQYGAALAELDRLAQSSSHEAGTALAHENQQRWLSVTLKWARAWVYDPSPEHLHMLERASRVARELGETGARALAEVEHWSSWICYALGDQERAIAHCRHALELATQASAGKLVAQLESNLGQSFVAAGEYEPGLVHLARALDRKRRGAPSLRPSAMPPGLDASAAAEPSPAEFSPAEVSVPIGFAYALANQGFVYGDMGDCARAERGMSAALQAVQGAGHAIEGSILALRALLQLLYGRWDDCVEYATRARSTAQRVHGPYVFAMSQTYSAYARFRLTGDRALLEEMHKALDWLERRGIGLYVSSSFAAYADALLASGDLAGAHDYAQRAIARAAQRDRLGESWAQRTLAQIHARALRDKLTSTAPGALEDKIKQALSAALASAEQRSCRRDRVLAELTALELSALGHDVGALAPAGPSPEARQRVLAELTALDMPWHLARAQRLLG